MIKKAGMVIAQVANMDRSVAFYRDVLCLAPSMVSEWWSTFPIGDFTIALHPPFAQGAKEPGRSWILGVEAFDIAELRRTLEAAGVACAPYHDVPGGCVMDFEDPDGYPIQAIQYGIAAKNLV